MHVHIHVHMGLKVNSHNFMHVAATYHAYYCIVFGIGMHDHNMCMEPVYILHWSR